MKIFLYLCNLIVKVLGHTATCLLDECSEIDCGEWSLLGRF